MTSCVLYVRVYYIQSGGTQYANEATRNGKNHFGQFIFTTHNVLHLDLKNYMKEQIYFVTKDIETLESELYSLADFPEIRYETTKIYEFYMKGILGGTAIE